LAAKIKCLADGDKTCTGDEATNKRLHSSTPLRLTLENRLLKKSVTADGEDGE
jgi:hypothetical protein